MSNLGFNYFIIDMAGMSKRERCALRLCGNARVPRQELAEAFEVPPTAIGRILTRATEKYARCARWLGVG